MPRLLTQGQTALGPSLRNGFFAALDGHVFHTTLAESISAVGEAATGRVLQKFSPLGDLLGNIVARMGNNLGGQDGCHGSNKALGKIDHVYDVSIEV